MVTFPQPLDRRIVGDLKREPGVLAAEGERIVAVRMRAGHRTYLTSVIGLPMRGELRRPHDAALRPIEIAPHGITLTRRLADRLGVATGDTMTVEVMEGKRRAADVPVSAIVDEVIGMTSYMEIDALNKLTGEGDVVSAVALYVENSSLPALSRRFKNLPMIAGGCRRAGGLGFTPEADSGRNRGRDQGHFRGNGRRGRQDARARTLRGGGTPCRPADPCAAESGRCGKGG